MWFLIFFMIPTVFAISAAQARPLPEFVEQLEPRDLEFVDAARWGQFSTYSVPSGQNLAGDRIVSYRVARESVAPVQCEFQTELRHRARVEQKISENSLFSPQKVRLHHLIKMTTDPYRGMFGESGTMFKVRFIVTLLFGVGGLNRVLAKLFNAVQAQAG